MELTIWVLDDKNTVTQIPGAAIVYWQRHTGHKSIIRLYNQEDFISNTPPEKISEKMNAYLSEVTRLLAQPAKDM